MHWMKTFRQEGISLILLSVYVIDISYSLQTWSSFQLWLNNLPYIGTYTWLIYPCVLLVAPVLVFLLIGGWRIAGLQLNLWVHVIFVAYLCIALLTSDIFFLPYHPWWNGMRWWDRMVISLGMAWLSWIAMRIEERYDQPVTIDH
jgi:hypothetical protein